MSGAERLAYRSNFFADSHTGTFLEVVLPFPETLCAVLDALVEIIAVAARAVEIDAFSIALFLAWFVGLLVAQPRGVNSDRWLITGVDVPIHAILDWIPLPESPDLRVVEPHAELEQGEIRILPVGMIPQLTHELVGLRRRTGFKDHVRARLAGITVHHAARSWRFDHRLLQPAPADLGVSYIRVYDAQNWRPRAAVIMHLHQAVESIVLIRNDSWIRVVSAGDFLSYVCSGLAAEYGYCSTLPPPSRSCLSARIG